MRLIFALLPAVALLVLGCSGSADPPSGPTTVNIHCNQTPTSGNNNTSTDVNCTKDSGNTTAVPEPEPVE